MPSQRSGSKRKQVCSDQPLHQRPTKQRKNSHRRKGKHTFRFLDLPAELRNRIYELACSVMKTSWSSKVNPSGTKKTPSRTKKFLPKNGRIPFISLTQTCRQIRSEFLPLWVQSHRPDLYELPKYLSLFFRKPAKKDVQQYEAYFQRAGELNILLSVERLGHTEPDVLRLLKLKADLPDYTVSFHSLPMPILKHNLDYLVNNQNPEWLRWIRGNRISQVRIGSGITRWNFHIVVNERWAEQWMKPWFQGGTAKKDEFCEKLGLGKKKKALKIDFSVCY